MTKRPWSSPCDGEAGLLLLNNSSIICSAILSSSSIAVAGEAVVTDVDCDAASVGAASLLSSTVMTQLESARAPARFCQMPMWDFSGSRRRQVREGDGALQHLRSLALRIWDRLAVDEPPPMLLRTSLPAAGAGSPVLLLWTGKFVLALRPLISTAASSYALAASSAVSKVPSHTLLLRRGCLISETQEPQWRCRTPRNFFGCTIFLEWRFSVMEDTGSRDELCWGSSELKCVAVWGRYTLG